MKEKVGLVKLADIARDTSTQMRQINEFTIQEYYHLLKAGYKFDRPIILERGTNRLVAGWHRFKAYQKAFEPTEQIECIFREYASEKELLADAVRDNLSHGRPLTTYDKKCILIKLEERGASLDEIASLLQMDAHRLGVLGQQCAIVETSSGQEKEPLPRDLVATWQGQVITEEQRDQLRRGRTGVPTVRLAIGILNHLKTNAVDELDEDTVGVLVRLYEALGQFLAGRADVA